MQTPQSNWAKGIDYSSNTGTVDFVALAKGGYTFAIGRALYGLSPDTTFASNYAATKQAGLIRGAYQFARPKLSTAQAAAAAMVKTIESAGGFDGLPPAIDAEYGSDVQGLSPEELTDWILAWVAEMKALVGVQGMLYTSTAFITECLQPQRLKGVPLWISSYGVSQPANAGSITQYNLWQHAAGLNSQLKVPGIAPYNQIDLNVFAGTGAELKSWCKEVNGVQATPIQVVVNGQTVDAYAIGDQVYLLWKDTGLQDKKVDNVWHFEPQHQVIETKVKVNGAESEAFVVDGDTYVNWAALKNIGTVTDPKINGEFNFTVTPSK
ncbi:glycoside hydrolase family 25 protein [Alicyclobacillus acidoterrestris]|uniref:glycoside hydrolase family 25 protein n=1 Tax=Alicyclobacillus acidoterrestris TaxID=1450 RepID=UPI003F530D9C